MVNLKKSRNSKKKFDIGPYKTWFQTFSDLARGFFQKSKCFDT